MNHNALNKPYLLTPWIAIHVSSTWNHLLLSNFQPLYGVLLFLLTNLVQGLPLWQFTQTFNYYLFSALRPHCNSISFLMALLVDLSPCPTLWVLKGQGPWFFHLSFLLCFSSLVSNIVTAHNKGLKNKCSFHLHIRYIYKIYLFHSPFIFCPTSSYYLFTLAAAMTTSCFQGKQFSDIFHMVLQGAPGGWSPVTHSRDQLANRFLFFCFFLNWLSFFLCLICSNLPPVFLGIPFQNTHI